MPESRGSLQANICHSVQFFAQPTLKAHAMLGLIKHLDLFCEVRPARLHNVSAKKIKLIRRKQRFASCACSKSTARIFESVLADRNKGLVNDAMRVIRTVWPSGLRRWLQAPVRKGVGSNTTAVIYIQLKIFLPNHMNLQ